RLRRDCTWREGRGRTKVRTGRNSSEPRCVVTYAGADRGPPGCTSDSSPQSGGGELRAARRSCGWVVKKRMVCEPSGVRICDFARLEESALKSFRLRRYKIVEL